VAKGLERRTNGSSNQVASSKRSRGSA